MDWSDVVIERNAPLLVPPTDDTNKKLSGVVEIVGGERTVKVIGTLTGELVALPEIFKVS